MNIRFLLCRYYNSQERSAKSRLNHQDLGRFPFRQFLAFPMFAILPPRSPVSVCRRHRTALWTITGTRLSFRCFENSRNVEVPPGTRSRVFSTPCLRVSLSPGPISTPHLHALRLTPKKLLSDPGHTDKLLSNFILYPFALILYIGGGSYLDGATTDHEHDHGGFPEPETRARLFAFFPLQL